MQAGQALVETLVLGIALVPLAVLVVLLGKYQSIQSATVAASRSLAFDCAVRPQTCSDPAAAGWLAESLRSRHFSRQDTPPLSGERAVGVQPLWHDRTGRPLLDHLTDVGAAVSAQRFDAGVGTALGRASSASGGAGGGSGSSGPSPAEVLDRLGPEPLADDFTLDAFRACFARRKGALKPLLLNQAVVAGVGNIYADEALHRARLHPLRRADTLSEDETAALYTALRQVLADGIAREGASVNWYRKPDGTKGNAQTGLQVYGHAGEPCPRCGTPILKTVVGQRGTHLCPACQIP